MKLENISIRNFRSIENSKIEKCGDFNIFIGKNNSGKSNILSSIDTFFSCIKGGNIVSLDPNFGEEIDFFDKKKGIPIEITLIFSLTSEEMYMLTHDIMQDAPQRKLAISNVDSSFLLSISVNIISSPQNTKSFSFVNKISLINPQMQKEAPEDSTISLLVIDNEAALELRDELARTVQEDKNAKGLNVLLSRVERDARLISRTEERPALEALRRYYPEFSLEFRRKVDRLISSSSSYDELSVKLRTLIDEERQKDNPIHVHLTHDIKTFAGDERLIPAYAKNLLEQISKTKLLYLKERREQIGKKEAEQILALKVERGGDETFRSIQNIVLSLLGVQINAFKSRSAVNAELDINDFLVEVNGAGIREALRVVLDVLFEQPNILLVEEPEIHLHPALETSMMQYLKQISSSRQVFITTHSTNFLDTAEMKNVYLVSKSHATYVQRVNFEEAEIQIPKELGIRPSSLFIFDKLVFVEGRSDEDIFRAWAQTLGINFGQANVGFIHMGGARNFTYFANEATLSFLKKRQVQMFFIIDRDEKDDAEIEKLRKSLQGNASIVVLKKREIENYLICPKALFGLINQKSRFSEKANQNTLTEDIVDDLIKDKVEVLKQITIDKRVAKALCPPIYPLINWEITKVSEKTIIEKIAEANQNIINSLKTDVESIKEIYKNQSEQINKIWGAEKFNLVPGDQLLDLVCQEYHVRFNKKTDGPTLANLMTKEEIDKEILMIIRQIHN